LFTGYFGIHTPPAGLAMAAFTEVIKIFLPTSVNPTSTQTPPHQKSCSTPCRSFHTPFIRNSM
jgi:hypothetical protein